VWAERRAIVSAITMASGRMGGGVLSSTDNSS
jgi:hypothetical protein